MPLLRSAFAFWGKVSNRLRTDTQCWVGRRYLTILGVRCGEKLKLYGLPIVELGAGSSITLGNHVILCSDSRRTALGVNHPVVIRTGRGAKLSIGDHTGISGGSFYAHGSVEIGPYCLLGANVTIADTDFHSMDPKNRTYSDENVAHSDVVIGRNVFLGTGSIILKGVHIGDNSVIGAGSVVVKNIPANSIAAGNPCRVIRPLPYPAPDTI